MLSVIIYDVVYKYWILLTGLFAGIIIYGSLWPLPELPVPGNDKTHHLIGYCCLALPVAIRQPKGVYYWFVGFAVASGLIELIQPYVNRYGEWLDLAANCTGITLAMLLARLITKLTPKQTHYSKE